jgi:tripartite-type tricarboxylate transporter receptor subunit TctC
MKTRSLIRAIALGIAAAFALPAQAQSYPSQPLKMIVPFPPGGGGDALARIIAPKIGESLKQTVVIENKPGASGVIATDFVIKAPADGHTILLHSMPIVMTPALFEKPPYDVVRDLTPLVELIYTPLWFAVSTARSQAKSVKEFIDQVRAEPKKHHYASISPGSTGHLFGFQFNETTKLDMEHVGYKGAAPATVALLAGDISGVFLDYSTLKPHVPTGKVRVLAVTGTGRSSQNPEVPTFRELGFNGFEGTSWAGLFVPKGTPMPVVQLLANTVNELLKQPDVVKRYGDLGYEIGIKSHAQFVSQVQTDRDHWSAILRKTGVKAQ